MKSEWSDSPGLVLESLAGIFQNLNIPYLIGGSIASSVQGEFRATNDIDLLCNLPPSKLKSFFEAISKEFVFEEDAIKTAVQKNKSFNIIHEETLLKVDIFTRVDPFEKEQLKRAISIKIPDRPAEIKVATPEDTILAKLCWYKLGNEVSDRQWRDIQGVIRVQGKNLDFTYLNKWAESLKISLLLERAFSESK